MDILDRLAKSKFRSRFKLGVNELNYIREKGLDKIKIHAEDFIRDRNSNMSTSDIKEYYDKIKLLDTQITKLKSQLKKADSIKDNVDLNMQIDKQRKEKDLLSNKI